MRLEENSNEKWSLGSVIFEVITRSWNMSVERSYSRKSIQACCRDEDWQYYDHTMASC